MTWQQVQGTENLETMIASTSKYFEEKKEVRDNIEDEKRKNYCYYDLHDGKMLYLLTQHSSWSRKFHPFLLCECKRGEGVKNNNNHQCKLIDSKTQVELFDRSARRYNRKHEKAVREGKEYSKKDHMDWVDEKNKGVSHFGTHPSILPRENLRFDTFHMKCSITRKLMSYLRTFILNQEPNVIDGFTSTVLKKIWNDYHIFIWNNRKNFSSFLGNELALFTGNVSKVNSFLSENLVQTSTIVDICTSLTLW